MKKILPFLALIALIGCTKEDLISSSDYSTPITYSITNVSDVTRASLTTNDNVAEKFPVMNVRAILKESDMNKSPNTTVFTSTLNTATAKSDEVRYWPEGHDSYIFYSYPVNSFEGEKINFHYDSFEARITMNRNTEDIVIARTEVASGQKVNFTYEHIFTAVSVVYKKVQYGHKITAIRIVDTPKRGLCKVRSSGGKTDVWWDSNKFDGTTTLEDTNLKYATHNGTDLTDGVAKFMTIPTQHKGADIKIEVDIDGKTIPAHCSCKHAGEHVTFYIEDDLTITQKDGAYCDVDDEVTNKKFTVDSYVTGEYTTTTTTSKAPIDFVLVLDLSGSMQTNKTMDGKTLRIDAVENSANSFLDKILSESTSSKITHRVSIVTFSDEGNTDGRTKTKEFIEVNSTNVSELKTYINTMCNKCRNIQGGSTAIGKAMEMARDAFASIRSDAIGTCVFLTDGRPNDMDWSKWKSGSSNAVTTYSQRAIAAAYQMKQKGITIFTVNLCGDLGDIDENTQTATFLDMLSSNYVDNSTFVRNSIPTYEYTKVTTWGRACSSKDKLTDWPLTFAVATIDKSSSHKYEAYGRRYSWKDNTKYAPLYNSGGYYYSDKSCSNQVYPKDSDAYYELTGVANTGITSGTKSQNKYYSMPASQADLTSAFVSIVTESVTGKVSVDVGKSAYVQLQLSNVVDLSKAISISCYTATQTGYNSSTKAITFGDKIGFSEAVTTISGNVIKVSGFDYASNFCGAGANGKGKKLVVEVSFTPNAKLNGTGLNEVLVHPSGLFNDTSTPIYLIDSPNITL